MEKIEASPYIPDDEVFVRMTLPERLQHWVVILTFGLLVLTGLPLMFYELKVFNWLFRGGQSFYLRGLVHRGAAVALIVNSLAHVAYSAFTPRGRSNLRDMWPRKRDFRDAVQAFGYNLGLSRFLHRKGLGWKFFRRHPFFLFESAPLYDRYNFIEKFEYWALVWGTMVMIVSGFFMWRVELSLRLFPLWVHHIFIIVHGYEAMLALLAVVIWHMYNVHLNPEVFPMSKVWLTGRTSGRELRQHHPLEYLRIHEERKRAAAAPLRAGRSGAKPEEALGPV
jgi:cytochrome b subunit of formate dehydrogenase